MKVRVLAVFPVVPLVGVAACAADTGSAASPSLTSTASSAAPADPTPSAGTACVAGTWRATGVRSVNTLGTISGRLAGGAGATMTVGANGVTQVGFQQSQPVDFTAEAAGATVRGTVKYRGSLHGRVRFESTGKGTGRWQPQAGQTGDDLRASVKLTDPVSVTLLDNAEIGDLSAAGDALNLLPVLRGGTYRCDAAGLQVRTERNGPTVTWMFARVS